MSKPLIQLSNLGLLAGKRTLQARFDLVITAGQRWVILGANGSGKTRLLHTLMNFQAPACGQLLLAGRPVSQWSVRDLARKIGILFQDYPHEFPLTLMERVLMGRYAHLQATRFEQHTLQQLLEQLELSQLAQRNMATLSGGERQRAAIACLLCQQTRILLLDEPCNHLDIRHQLQALNLFNRAVIEQGATLIAVMHDINLAQRFFDHCILLKADGQVLTGPIKQLLTENNLQAVYQCPIKASESAEGRVWHF